MMAILMLVYRIAPGAGMLLLPLWLLLILMLAVGLGLFAAALMASYRDVQYVLPVVVNLLTLASPVGFAASTVLNRVPENLRPFYFLLNPMASLQEAFRWSMLGQGEVLRRAVLPVDGAEVRRCHLTISHSSLAHNAACYSGCGFASA